MRVRIFHVDKAQPITMISEYRAANSQSLFQLHQDAQTRKLKIASQ